MLKITWLSFALFLALLSPVHCEEDDDIVVDDEAFDGEESVYEEPVMEYEYEEEEEEWDGITLIEHSDIITTVTFPGHPDKRLPLKEELTVLIGVTNNGKEVYNISIVGGALHSPYDFDYYIQNFTRKAFSEVMPPTAQYTLEYKFTPESKLEPLEYWFSIFIMINGTQRIYRNYAYNSTLTLTSASTNVFADIASVLFTLMILSGVGFGVYTMITGGKKSKSKTKSAAPVVRNEDDEDDWDTDVYTQAKTSRAVGKKAPKNKAKKAD